MIRVEEQHVDRITEAFYMILKGKKPSLIILPNDHPDNEIKQAVSYINRFIKEYDEGAGHLARMSKGELDFDPPRGHSAMLQSLPWDLARMQTTSRCWFAARTRCASAIWTDSALASPSWGWTGRMLSCPTV